MRSTPERDLRPQLDADGMVGVEVVVGTSVGARERVLAVVAAPGTVARYLREVADDVERLTGP